MALARMGIEYPRKLRAEGRAEGRAAGLAEGRAQGLDEGRTQWLAHERTLLLRMATRKFDAQVAERLEPMLAGMEDAARLAEVADWIIDCDAGEDLLARVPQAGNGR